MDDSEQSSEVSSDQWMAENCNPKVAKISNAGDSEAVYALLAGPVSAPQEISSIANIDQIRVYTYDEAANTMTPVRALSPGETLCYDSTAETNTASPRRTTGRWILLRSIRASSRMEHGLTMFRFQCSLMSREHR